jgi:hypothetical protein
MGGTPVLCDLARQVDRDHFGGRSVDIHKDSKEIGLLLRSLRQARLKHDSPCAHWKSLFRCSHHLVVF